MTRTASLARNRSNSLMTSPWKSGLRNPSTTSWTGPIAMSVSLSLHQSSPTMYQPVPGAPVVPHPARVTDSGAVGSRDTARDGGRGKGSSIRDDELPVRRADAGRDGGEPRTEMGAGEMSDTRNIETSQP